MVMRMLECSTLNDMFVQLMYPSISYNARISTCSQSSPRDFPYLRQLLLLPRRDAPSCALDSPPFLELRR